MRDGVSSHACHRERATCNPHIGLYFVSQLHRQVGGMRVGKGECVGGFPTIFSLSSPVSQGLSIEIFGVSWEFDFVFFYVGR